MQLKGRGSIGTRILNLLITQLTAGGVDGVSELGVLPGT